MKHLRRTCAGFFLLLALSMTAFAGDITNPPVAGEINIPGVAGDMGTPPVAGGMSTPSVEGDIPSPPGVTGDILTPGINLLVSILF